jgi:hypothetical protein
VTENVQPEDPGPRTVLQTLRTPSLSFTSERIEENDLQLTDSIRRKERPTSNNE